MFDVDIDALWNYEDAAASERAFAALLDDARLSEDVALRAEVLTQLARAQGLQRKFVQAHATLDQAQAHIDTGMTRPQIRLLLERGRVFNSSGNPNAARPYFQQALDLGVQTGQDAYAIDAAHMLAIVAPSDQGEQALAWNERALEMAEASSNDKARRWLGSLYNNIGWTYHGMGRHVEALAVFERALDWRIANRRDTRDDNPIRIARWSVARALRSLGRVEDALVMQHALIGELHAINERDGYVFEEIGECLLHLGQAAEAKPYFAQAYAELSKDDWFVTNEPARLQRLNDLSV